MSLVALACVGAGTFEITRYAQKVHQNKVLTANAHAAPVPLSTALVPLVGHGPTPDKYAIRYRTVTVTGTYADTDEFVRNQTLSGTNGYYVLTPLRTNAGVLLIVRGFVAAGASGGPPTTVTAAPQGPMQVTGRLQTAGTNADDARQLGNGQLESVNPAEQATRLGRPTYDAYLTLNAGQPGTAGVTALPEPDLSNPAGGAYSWQNLAYVVQWYLFALLALAAPFAISRHEARETARRFGVDPDAGFSVEAQQRPELGAAGSSAAELAVRGRGTLAQVHTAQTERQQRAARLADRYGLSLGPTPPGHATTTGRPRPTPDTDPADGRPIAPSQGRYADAYHASYNDYLWLLAMTDGAGHADGENGRAALAPADHEDSPATIEGTVQGTVIEGSPAQHSSSDDDGRA